MSVNRTYPLSSSSTEEPCEPEISATRPPRAVLPNRVLDFASPLEVVKLSSNSESVSSVKQTAAVGLVYTNTVIV